MKTKHLIAALALAAGFVVPSIASAQHTGFTLFGSPNAEGNSLPAERVAVHPVTSPYYHEDSFITTDIRGWYLYHSFADIAPIKGVGGGDANVYAVQARVALTDRLQLVAYKDGYTALNSGAVQESGYNDLAAGLKYAVIQDWKNDFHVAVGAGYQFAIGDESVLQNDQVVRFWTSANKGFEKLHLGATVNYFRMVGNENALGSAYGTWAFHLHADYWVNKWISPVAELNWYVVGDKGDEVLEVSGADVGFLGGGDDVITGALGLEVRPGIENLKVRAAYETDIAGGDSVFGFRWTFSVIYSF